MTMTSGFDRSTEDLGNVTHLEHVNLMVPDQLVATQFYISALGLTRDPYMMTGIDNMWVNAGETQFHLPHGAPQHFRGTIVIVIPERQTLLERLQRQAPALRGTHFEFAARDTHVDVRCPWGNRLRCVEPDPARYGGTTLGFAQLEIDVPRGSAEGIARFYREMLGARVTVAAGADGSLAARVQVGAWQFLVFGETGAAITAYDGHHIQVYVADFSGPHRRLQEHGLITEESSQYQYRFVDIVDPSTRAPLFQLEHEVRSMSHPMFRRLLISRNPEQNARDYRRGRDPFVP